jgi:hypothetical protein
MKNLNNEVVVNEKDLEIANALVECGFYSDTDEALNHIDNHEVTKLTSYENLAKDYISQVYKGLRNLNAVELETYFDLELFASDFCYDTTSERLEDGSIYIDVNSYYNIDNKAMNLYIPDYNEDMTDTEVAKLYIDEIGGLEKLNQHMLEKYFDYARFGKDLMLTRVSVSSKGIAILC